jgi:repressor LexA
MWLEAMRMHKTIGEVLTARRKELGLSQAELAGALAKYGVKVTNQAVSKWENDATEPGAEQFLALCAALGIDDVRGAFSGGAGDGYFRGLNYEGRRKALEYIDLLRSSGRFSQKAERAAARMLPLYSLAVSAGTGQFLDGEDYEMTEADDGVPGEANFGVRVSGNSMEPKFHDGQIVWVRQQRSLENGETGIFLYDGSAYLKQLFTDDRHLILHSLNPEYQDIYVSAALPLRVLGKVL